MDSLAHGVPLRITGLTPRLTGRRKHRVLAPHAVHSSSIQAFSKVQRPQVQTDLAQSVLLRVQLVQPDLGRAPRTFKSAGMAYVKSPRPSNPGQTWQCTGSP